MKGRVNEHAQAVLSPMNNKGETIISDGTGGNDTFENTHHTFDDIRQVNRVKFTVKNEFLSS